MAIGLGKTGRDRLRDRQDRPICAARARPLAPARSVEYRGERVRTSTKIKRSRAVRSAYAPVVSTTRNRALPLIMRS